MTTIAVIALLDFINQKASEAQTTLNGLFTLTAGAMVLFVFVKSRAHLAKVLGILIVAAIAGAALQDNVLDTLQSLIRDEFDTNAVVEPGLQE